MQTIMDLVKKYGIYILAFYLLKSMFKKRSMGKFSSNKYSVAQLGYGASRYYGRRAYRGIKQRYNKFRGR